MASPAAPLSALALTLALVALAGLSPRLAAGCEVSNVDVRFASAPAKLMDGAYTADGVRQHFESELNRETVAPTTAQSVSCVDSRSEAPVLGSPGGDIAEFIGGLAVYLKKTGQPVTQKLTDEVFNEYIKQFGPGRQFYYHTSDEKLQKVFHSLRDSKVGDFVAFPPRTPKDEKVAAAWLEALSKGDYQGCGHMRLMINQPADYGFNNSDIPRDVIKSFFKHWWPSNLRSDERKRVNFALLPGSLSGRALAIVSNKGACVKDTPLVASSSAGSQIFVFHGTAIQTIRHDVISKWFVDFAKKRNKKTLDQKDFFNSLQAFQTKQLGSTLKYLEPVNAIRVFDVTLTTTP